MYLWTVLFVVQLNFFISYGYLLSCFNNVSDSEHCELNEILVERSIFQYNIQKSVPRSLQLKKMLFWRIEMCIWDLKFQRQIRQEIIEIDKRKLKMFTRFVSKLVFRVSGKSALWDIPVTSSITFNFPV